MKEQTLSDLADLVASHLNLMPSRADWPHVLLKEARKELRAMRTRVSTTELKAAKWKEKTIENDVFPVTDFKRGRVVVRVGGGMHTISLAGKPIFGVDSMYDLNELVRLSERTK